MDKPGFEISAFGMPQIVVLHKATYYNLHKLSNTIQDHLLNKRKHRDLCNSTAKPALCKSSLKKAFKGTFLIHRHLVARLAWTRNIVDGII